MKSLIKPLRDIGFLTIALTLALVANFAYGQWANPTAAPLGDNVALPIHEDGGTQTKAGSIGAIQLLASDKMRSDLYCDFDGNNCFRPCEVSGSCVAVAQGTWQTGSWSGCTGACGTTGTRYRSVTCSSSAGCAGSQPASTQSCTTNACALRSCATSSPSRGPFLATLPAASHGAVVTLPGNSSWTSGTYQCFDGTWNTIAAPVQDRGY
jgi:hypothetical protein